MARGSGDLLAAWRTGAGRVEAVHAPREKGESRLGGRAITVRRRKKLPRVLTVARRQAVLDSCTRLRDRFFLALMHATGWSSGRGLGLRHEDIAAPMRDHRHAAGERERRKRKSGSDRPPSGRS